MIVRIVLIAVALVALLILGTAAYLMFADVPAPSTPIEHPLPDARFPR